MGFHQRGIFSEGHEAVVAQAAGCGRLTGGLQVGLCGAVPALNSQGVR